MKLAAKLTLSLASVAVLAIAADAWMDQRRRADLLALDTEKNWRFARVLQANVETLWDENGPEVAERLVESTNEAIPQRDILFKWLSEFPADLQLELPVKRMSEDVAWRYVPDEKSGSETRYVYIPLKSGGETQAAIEAGESLEKRDAFLRREHIQSATTGLVIVMLSGLLAVVLGAWLVERPLHLIRQSVRALGEGRPAPPIRIDRRDELGDLARELNVASERMVERERLQHVDRLQTIGQLASGIAHELGTPLSVIGVRARLIASGEALGAEARASAAAILDQSARMTSIVRQLLDYARRQGSQGALLDLRHVVSGSVGMLEPLAEKHQVQVDVVLPTDPIFVRGDQTQLQQVVTNIAMNGIQAMSGAGKLRVEVGRGPASRPEAQGGGRSDWVWVRVIDDGPGIAPEHQPHIFEPFYTTKPVGEGTGLGLAVVQAIVHDHGGWIVADNEPGHGARFDVFLAPAREESTIQRLAS
jgi:two-component system, NtrC family, sensor kinase